MVGFDNKGYDFYEMLEFGRQISKMDLVGLHKKDP